MNSKELIAKDIQDTIEELKELENYARENEESYSQTVDRLYCEGYLAGLQRALAQLENGGNK